ncbi:MAG: porin [Pseudomonadota bacterium]
MNFKRLVLGTAAGALAVTGAQAADLPVVVEPVDYVRICDAVGTGYFFIPGTETCMRIRTRVRTDYALFFDLDDTNDYVLAGNGYDNFADVGYLFRARGYVRMNTVTQTEFGQLETFVDIFVTNDNGTDLGADVDSALIQLGGIIFGRFATAFNSSGVGSGVGVYTTERTFDLGNQTGNANQIQYIASFGNGLTGQIAIQDTNQFRRGIVNGAYGGSKFPDLVAKISVEQGWGAAYLSGAVRYLETSNNGGVTTNDDFGFAVSGGVEVNVPFGTGTVVGIQGSYGYGATGYTYDSISTVLSVPTGISDAAYVGNQFELSTAAAVVAGVKTNFTPTVSGALGAGWTYLDNELIGDAYNLNFQGTIGWTPVSGLGFTFGAEYRFADTEFNNGVSVDDSALTTFMRVQADF